MGCEKEVEGLLEIISEVANKRYELDNWRHILDLTAKLLDADVCAMGELRDGFIYYTRLSSNVHRFVPDFDPEKYRVPALKSGYVSVLKHGCLLVNDYQNYDLAVPVWKQAGIKSMMATMLGDREPLGSLSVGRFTSDEPFTEQDAKILRSLAFVFTFVVREETEKKELLERAVKDYLTKLYNRFYLEQEGNRELQRAVRYSYPVSMGVFDIDDFKNVNDTYGHQSGDTVLVKFARIIKRNIRSSDIPVRYGGEEFVIMFPHTYPEEAAVVSNRIREEFANTVFNFDKDVVRLTVSAGISGYEEGMGLDDLIDRADKAMYEAKRHGKNRVYIYVADRNLQR